MKVKIAFLLFAYLLLSVSAANSATISSAASGNWGDGATWVGGTVPSSTDSIVISSGHTVLFNRNDALTTCATIEIQNTGVLRFDSTPADPKTMQVKGDINVYGTLELVPGSTLKMECETNGQYGIIVYAGGTLKGTGSVPTVLTTLTVPLAIGGQAITVASTSGFGVGDIITLGSGASAEGFTIASIAGSTITLDRKAINAQEVGAEVYKNATVTTSNISPGSRTFTVADVGGIKAGDVIVIAATKRFDFWQNETEIMTVESVNTATNSITLINSLNYSHQSGAYVMKINRDCIITSTRNDRQHCGYITVRDLGIFKFDYSKFEYLGRANTWNTGIEIQSDAAICPFKGCVLTEFSSYTLVSIYGFSNSIKPVILSNIIIPNFDYQRWGWSGVYGIHFYRCAFLSNICLRSYRSFYGSNSLVAYNHCFLNNEGMGIDGRCVAYTNKSFFNGNGIECRFENNLIYGNDSYLNGCGIRSYNGNNNYYIFNNFLNNDYGADFSSYPSNPNINNMFAYNNLLNNRWYDFEGEVWDHSWGPLEPLQIIIRNCNFNHPSLQIASRLYYSKENYILLQEPVRQPGITKIYGYYIKEGMGNKFNYSDPSFSNCFSEPILARGKDHILSVGTSSSTTSEVWFVTYQAAVGNWEVKGTVSGLQLIRAFSGAPYTSDLGQISLWINAAPGIEDGDQFIFATLAEANDANTQKKILFKPSLIENPKSESGLIVNSGQWLELMGNSSYPTLIDYDGVGNYKFVISGEVVAEYFDFNQISSEGVQITPSANIHRFDHGSIRNVAGSGPHLSVDGKDHTFNYLSFDDSGAYDVKAVNDADLIFSRSQRGVFADSVLDTSSVTWDDPVLGYTSNYILGPLSYDSGTKVLTIPFKIKDPNSSACTYKGGSFQYSTNSGSAWNSVADSNLNGIDAPFASSTSFDSAPEHKIYWNTSTNYSNLEANLKVRFMAQNGYVYGNYGASEVMPFNIKPPVVAVSSPNGGEKFWGGRTTTIQWTAQDEGSGIAENSIEIYYATGESEVLIAKDLSNSGSYTWTVPEIDSTSVKIKITARDNIGEIGSDYSDNCFTIAKVYDVTPPTISNVRVNGRNYSPGDSISSRPEFNMDISDDYGLDSSQIYILVDDSQPRNVSSISTKNPSENKNVSASYKFPENDKVSVGSHAFKIQAADEVGNTGSWEATLFVVGDSIPGLLIYPNPYKLGTASGIKFDGLTEDIRIRVYDIAGELVWMGQNIPGSTSFVWNAVNSAGNQLAPGVYLYLVTTVSGGKQSGKIAIIR